jgi:hypothetical protein
LDLKSHATYCINTFAYFNHSRACLSHTCECGNDIHACQNTFCVWKSHSACINRTRACQNSVHACGNYIRACENHTLRAEISNIFQKFLDLLVSSQASWTFIIDLWLKRYQYIATYFILDTQDVLLKWVSCWCFYFLWTKLI